MKTVLAVLALVLGSVAARADVPPVAAHADAPVAAHADPPTLNPYRVWWSFPNDDKTAVEVDDPDLSVTNWESRWEFARDMRSCDVKASQKLAQRRDKTVREVKIETLDGDGQVRATFRCVMTIAQWKHRIGARLFDRLDFELDAHEGFLHPRRYPGMPENPSNPPRKPLEDDGK